MMEEFVAALPPLGNSKVLDLLAGSGMATVSLLKAYPRARVSIVEKCPLRVHQCKGALARMEEPTHLEEVFQQEITIFSSGACLPGGPYDMIVASLALHTLVGHQAQSEEDVINRYKTVFEVIYKGLKPGGHLMIADHVGVCGLYSQLRIMEDVGFTDVDVSWRQEAFFVA